MGYNWRVRKLGYERLNKHPKSHKQNIRKQNSWPKLVWPQMPWPSPPCCMPPPSLGVSGGGPPHGDAKWRSRFQYVPWPPCTQHLPRTEPAADRKGRFYCWELVVSECATSTSHAFLGTATAQDRAGCKVHTFFLTLPPEQTPSAHCHAISLGPAFRDPKTCY